MAEEKLERYIIGFHDEIDETLIYEHGGEIVFSLDSIHALTVNLSPEQASKLAKLANIQFIEKDEPVSLPDDTERKPATNQRKADQTFSKLDITGEQQTEQKIDWGVERTNAPYVWKNGLTGKGIKIAILDTGVNRTHPDLKIKKGASFVSYTTNFEDDNGHGTHVAGIIAAQNNNYGTVGMVPDAEIYVAKVLNQDGNGLQSNILKGIEWAMQQNVDIINLSVGGSASTTAFENTLKKAYDQGILIVAAAGNNREKGIGVEYPAALPSVIAVGAIDKNDNHASFSAEGNEVDVSAPGVDIYSTYLNGTYELMTGTSMASPHVVGHLALLKESHPNLSHLEIRKLLEKQTVDLGEAGRDPKYGYGRIELPQHLQMQKEPVKFRDLSNQWYADPIQRLVQQEIIFGYEDNTVRPLANITRAEATVMILRALKMSGTPYENQFPDVESSYYAAGAIQAAFNNQLISGFPDGSFRPKSRITRGEAAVILVRAFEIPLTDQTNIFKDVKQPYFATSAIHSLAVASLSVGYEDQTFKPNQPITRAEFATLLTRILDYKNE